jgi:acyl-coenzyme A thioesterase PaaI-like protein
MKVHQEWLEKFKEKNPNLTLPSPAMVELQMEYIEVDVGRKLIGKLPFQSRFSNPTGVFQGGMLAAGIDDVFGPLAYMSTNSACITLSLNLTYLGAFNQNMGHCLIQAIVLKQTKNFIFMRAEVTSPTGEIIAHAESHMKVL